jgi:hypothetical protein
MGGHIQSMGNILASSNSLNGAIISSKIKQFARALTTYSFCIIIELIE